MSISITTRARNIPHVSEVLAVVCEEYEISIESLLSRDRHKTIAESRQVAAYFLRVYCRSYPEIGAILGLHHTTIMSSLRSITAKYGRDPIIAGRMSNIATHLLNSFSGELHE